MTIQRQLRSRTGTFIGRLRKMIFGIQTSSQSIFSLLQDTIDYRKEIRDLTDSDVVMAPIHWMMRTFPEAPIAIREWQLDSDTGEMKSENVMEHAFLDLIDKPNPFYPTETLWSSTILSYAIDGNAYWMKIYGNGGMPVQLWWVPHTQMEPLLPGDLEGGSDSVFINYYCYYAPGRGKFLVSPEDVIHFRFGQDIDNPRKGLSPLKSALREVYTDKEAADWTATLLKNGAVPGLTISPDGMVPGTYIEENDLRAAKRYMEEEYSGKGRGKPHVSTIPIKIEQFGFSPEQMSLKDLRRLPEERISALLGIPAIVAGLGAGLDRCLPGDSRVWTVNGAKRIRDVKVGDKVWSEVDGKLEALSVTNWAKTGEQLVYQTRTKNRIVRSSGNHPILVRIPGSITKGNNEERRVRYGYKRADEIEIGDHIVQVKSLPDQGGDCAPNGYPVTKEMMMWLGAMIGDGGMTEGGRFQMSMPPEDRCHDDYVELAEGLFTKQSNQSGGNISIQVGVDRAQIVVSVRERSFEFSSMLWVRTLKEWGFGGTAKTKRIPSWVYGLRRDLRLALIAGIVDSDGSVNKLGSLKIGLANEALIHDLRDLMISCGIQCCNVSYGEVPGHRLPNPGRKEFYPFWAFTASSAKQVAEIPFTDWLYRERVEENMQRYRVDGFDAWKTGLNPNEMGFYEVKAIEIQQPEMLYDIEVNGGGHNFIADGVIVSNSTFANMSEAREMAYESNIIPTQRIFATTLNHQLLERDFNKKKPTRGRRSDPDRAGMGKGKKEEKLEVFFDTANVRVLQEDENTKVERLSRGVSSGFIRVSEARQELNLPTNEFDEVYLRPQGITEILADEERPDPIDMMMAMAEAEAGVASKDDDDDKKPAKNDNNEKDAQQRQMEKDKEEVEGKKVASELERFKSFWELVHDDEKGEEFTLKVLAAFAEERKRWDNEKAAKEFMETDFGTQNPEVKGSEDEKDDGAKPARNNDDGVHGGEAGEDDQGADSNRSTSGTHAKLDGEERILHDERVRGEGGRGIHEVDGDEGINESEEAEKLVAEVLGGDRETKGSATATRVIEASGNGSVEISGRGEDHDTPQSDDIGSEGLDVGRVGLEGSEGEVRGGEGEQNAVGNDEGGTHFGGVDDVEDVSELAGERRLPDPTESAIVDTTGQREGKRIGSPATSGDEAHDGSSDGGDRRAGEGDAGDNVGRTVHVGNDQGNARVDGERIQVDERGDVHTGEIQEEGGRSVGGSEAQRGNTDDDSKRQNNSEIGSADVKAGGDDVRGIADSDNSGEYVDREGPQHRNDTGSGNGSDIRRVEDSGEGEVDHGREQARPSEQDDEGRSGGSGTGTGRESGDQHDDSDSGSDRSAVDADAERVGGTGPTGSGGRSGLRSESGGSGGRVDGTESIFSYPDGGEDTKTNGGGNELSASKRGGEHREKPPVRIRPDARTDPGKGGEGDRVEQSLDGLKSGPIYENVATPSSIPYGHMALPKIATGGDGNGCLVDDDENGRSGVSQDGGRDDTQGNDDDGDVHAGTLDAGEVEGSVDEIEGAGTGALRVDAGANDKGHDTGDTLAYGGGGDDNGRADSGDESEGAGAKRAGVHSGQASGDHAGPHVGDDAPQDKSEDSQTGNETTGNAGVRDAEQSDIQVHGGLDGKHVGGNESDSRRGNGDNTTIPTASAHHSDHTREEQGEDSGQNGQTDRTVRGEEGDGDSSGHDLEGMDEGHPSGRKQREQDEATESDNAGVLGLGSGDDGSTPVQRAGSDPVDVHEGEPDRGTRESKETVRTAGDMGELAQDSNESTRSDGASTQGVDDGHDDRNVDGVSNRVQDSGTNRENTNDDERHDDNEHDVETERPEDERRSGGNGPDDSDGEEKEEGSGDDDFDPDDGDGGGTPDNDNGGGGAGHSDQGSPNNHQEGDGDRVSTTVLLSTTASTDLSVSVLPNATDLDNDDGRDNRLAGEATDDDYQVVGTERHVLHGEDKGGGNDNAGGRDGDLRLGHTGQGNGGELGRGDDPLTKQASEKKSPYDSGEIMFGLLDALGIQYKQRTREADQLINNLTTALPALADVLNRELEEKFAELGTLSRSVFLRNSNLILTSDGEGNLTFAPDKIGDAVEQLRLTEWKKDELGPLFENHTARVAQNTVENIGTVMNIAINIPDPVMRQLILDGGKRVGLVDIEGDTRSAIFRSLHEGRALGEGAQPLARRIREEVPAGRFRRAGPKYRSMLISRTESKWSQNESSLRAYEAHQDITHVIAYDAQLGADRSDPDCIARNGREFPVGQARAELGKEHPNGTLSFAPVVKPGSRRGGREDAITSDATRTDETPHVDDLARPWTGPPSGVDPRNYTPEQIREAERLYPRRLRTSYRTRPISGGDARKRVANIHDPIEPTLGMISKEVGSIRQRLVDIRNRAYLNRVNKFDKTSLPNDLFEQIWFEYLDEMLVTKRRYYSLAQQRKYIEETRDDLIFKALEPTDQGRNAKWSMRRRQQHNPTSGAIEFVDPTELDTLIVEDGMNMFNRMVRQWPRSDIDVEFVPAPVGRAGQVSIGNNRSLIFYDGYQDRFWYEEWETIVHEMGHALSTADQEILQEAVDFMYSRTKGDRLQSMRSLTGQPYGSDELTRPNEFFDPYVGLEYAINKRVYQRLAKREGDNFAYANDFVVSPYNPNEMLIGEEVVAMGLEFMTRSPYLFSRTDSEHFDFILERIMYRNRIGSDRASYRIIREATE